MSDGVRSIFFRDLFGIRSRFVRDACLPACLPACMQAGSRYSYRYGTSYHEYSYISRTRGRSYGTVGAAMRPRCGDPPNEVCTAVGKLDLYFAFVFYSSRKHRENNIFILVRVWCIYWYLLYGVFTVWWILYGNMVDFSFIVSLYVSDLPNVTISMVYLGRFGFISCFR